MTSALGASPPPAAPPPPLLCSPWFSSVPPSTAATIGGAWFQIGANPGAFIRSVFRTLALDLLQTFELLPLGHGADAAVRFRTPDDREAAMRWQPFQLDGAAVKLVRERETSNCSRARNDYIAHVALRDYPSSCGQPIKPHLRCATQGGFSLPSLSLAKLASSTLSSPARP